MRQETVQSNEVLKGSVLLLAPHMDDEVLGCGGALAAYSDKRRVRVVFVADGGGSRAMRVTPWPAGVAGEIRAVRKAESVRALGILGIHEDQIEFWDYPDGEIGARRVEIEDRLRCRIEQDKPDCVLAPFRYDRHPDHVALGRLARVAVQHSGCQIRFLEYFIYWQWQLIPGCDIRRQLRSDWLRAVDTRAVAETKRRALECFLSQRTVYYPGQRRPVLTGAYLERNIQDPEWFLCAPQDATERELFRLPLLHVRLAHALEPRLKRGKERLLRVLGLKRRGIEA